MESEGATVHGFGERTESIGQRRKKWGKDGQTERYIRDGEIALRKKERR